MTYLYKKNLEAKKALKKGAVDMADLINLTLGPKSQTVTIEMEHQSPKITRDGATVAKWFAPENKYELTGAMIAKQGTGSSDSLVGDNTSTTANLYRAILNQIDVEDSANIINVSEISRSLLADAELVYKEIDKVTHAMTLDKVRPVVMTAMSSNPNAQMVADMLHQVFEKLGPDGVVGFERTSRTETVLDLNSGMTTQRGYQDARFINDPQTGEAKLDNPFILVTDQKMDDIPKLDSLLVKLQKAGLNNLVIVSDDLSPAVLAKLAVYQQTGRLNNIAIKAPGFGVWRKEYLADLALYTGAKFFSKDTNDNIGALELTDLGRCGRVKCNIWAAIFIEGPQSQRALCEAKAADLKVLNITDPSELRKKQISNLIGGVGMIYVGGTTEGEIDELAYKVQDAINATKSAYEQGYVAGGGSTLDRILFSAPKAQQDTLLFNSLCSPMLQIAENAGISSIDTDKVLSGLGLNAMTGEYVDMIEAGIIDSAKGIKTAVKNAVSVAINIISVGASLVIPPKEHEAVDEYGMPRN